MALILPASPLASAARRIRIFQLQAREKYFLSVFLIRFNNLQPNPLRPVQTLPARLLLLAQKGPLADNRRAAFSIFGTSTRRENYDGPTQL